MNKERLLRLAEEILPNVPEDNFNLATWKERNECGTTACAIGWACLDEQFNEEGLTYDEIYATPRYNNHLFWRAVREFFGLTQEQACDLFMEGGYDVEKRYHRRAVMDRIKMYVAHGSNLPRPTA